MSVHPFLKMPAVVWACVTLATAGPFPLTAAELPVAPAALAVEADGPAPRAAIMSWPNARRWSEQSGSPVVLLLTQREDKPLLARVRSMLDMAGRPRIVVGYASLDAQPEVWRWVRQPCSPSLTWLVRWRGTLALDHVNRPPLRADRTDLRVMLRWCDAQRSQIPNDAIAPLGYCPLRPAR